ncbi:hypothetical protein LS68_005495 [Helicobacter sp. MIT 05-5293]|uniref:hypothetical protein n=1 Tax=Helicobacter sp. MIT 05-5293 TaxID=1548149 RepID=UPI00051E10F9|nr:hypothetical protein [Helicobacter sp. MIT 05-5293]TLD80925.1 hypothetical protein LS68_005495 [Helicobacter sp. MIT 05-5293]
MLNNPTLAQYSEMVKNERAFVLETIKKHQPKKILEIGIAAGANSALILDYLESNQLLDSTMLYAMDYSEYYYRDLCKEESNGGGGNNFLS